MLSFRNIVKDQDIKSIQLLEETLKKFLRWKHSSRCPEDLNVEVQKELGFCSFLGCVHFSTAGTDKEK